MVEQGTHDELMEAQGLYYELWTSQELGSSTSLASKVPASGATSTAASTQDFKKLANGTG